MLKLQKENKKNEKKEIKIKGHQPENNNTNNNNFDNFPRNNRATTIRTTTTLIIIKFFNRPIYCRKEYQRTKGGKEKIKLKSNGIAEQSRAA